MAINEKDWMKKWAVYSPNKVAIKETESNRQYTYSEINHIANRLAEEFAAQDISKGDRIMLLAEHCMEYVILFSVAQKLGIVLVPINYRLSTPEIDYLIENCEPAVLLRQIRR